jgi:hypothetical protein
MSEIAIRVDKLGKRYRIGSRGSRFKYRSLRDDLSGLGKRLLQRLGGKKNELQALSRSTKGTLLVSLGATVLVKARC